MIDRAMLMTLMIAQLKILHLDNGKKYLLNRFNWLTQPSFITQALTFILQLPFNTESVLKTEQDWVLVPLKLQFLQMASPRN